MSSPTSQQSPVTAQTPCSDAGTKSRQLFVALVAAYEEKKPQLSNYSWALANYHGASASYAINPSLVFGSTAHVHVQNDSHAA
jgi:hypothetical protein